MSGHILSKKGFKLVFESNAFVLTKSGMYMGKGNLSDGHFKINFTPKITVNKNMIAFSYIVGLCSLWHSRLGH